MASLMDAIIVYQWLLQSTRIGDFDPTILRAPFVAAIVGDARIKIFLDREALEHTFDLNRQLRHVDAIFSRVFA